MQIRWLAMAALGALLGLSPPHASAAFTDTIAVHGNTLTAASLSPPSGLTAQANPSTIVLEWTPGPTAWATGHLVLRATSSEGPYAQLGSVEPATIGTFTDTSATVGVTYHYRVRSFVGNWTSAAIGDASATVPASSTSVFESTADTFTGSGSANQNQGTLSYLRIQSSGHNRSFVAFDGAELASQASGRSVATATLRLYISDNANNWGTSGRPVDVHRVLASWTETGATWNCPIDTNTANSAPDCAVQWSGGSYEGTATASALHTNDLTGWVDWDVTADVAAMILSPSTNYGWLVKKSAEGQNGRVDYDSRQGTHPPQLVVTFED